MFTYKKWRIHTLTPKEIICVLLSRCLWHTHCGLAAMSLRTTRSVLLYSLTLPSTMSCSLHPLKTPTISKYQPPLSQKLYNYIYKLNKMSGNHSSSITHYYLQEENFDRGLWECLYIMTKRAFVWCIWTFCPPKCTLIFLL